MTRAELSDDEDIARFRAELRAVGRGPRLAGVGLVILGAVLVWTASVAGSAGPAVQFGGYAALAAGWVLILAAIFIRTRHLRRRLREGVQ